MIDARNNFSGGLNLDDTLFNVPKNQYIDALNITTDGQAGSHDTGIANVVGNRLVDFSMPTGENVCIGAKADQLRNRVYYFVWNSYDQHLILMYENATRTIIKLIENLVDTGGENVLSFSRNKKIIHIDIIYRDNNEGDLLFWTDGEVTPRKINVKHILDNKYSVIKTAFIELAKAPPLSPPSCVYGNDIARNANSLRKKLFMFTQRFIYDDYEKTTFSTYSKIPLTIGYYGSDNDISNTSNNFITITVETGDENVSFIEIAMRSNIGNTWGDFVLVASLNKEQLSIPDNSTYDFLFYNDGVYPPLDLVTEVLPLFDWVPQKANAQCLPNGNVVDFAGITENYDNYPVNDIDVTLTVENVKNVPPDNDPPQVTYQFTTGNVYQFTLSGTIPEGTQFTATALIMPGYNQITLYDYTTQPGDNYLDVINGIFGSISPPYQNGTWSNGWYVQLPSGSMIITTNVIMPVSPTQISTEKTWMWNANYIFGIVYVDEQNRDMPGVTTFSNPNDVDNDFLVTTPSFSLDSTDVETPVISASINHLPPSGAVKYYWVRRRMTYSDFIMYMTCDYQDPSDGYLYFCLANIDAYKVDNTQFIYDKAPITSESRIRIIAGVTAGVFDGDIWNQDYEILGTVTKTLAGGSSPANDKLFVKVKKPAGSISPSYSVNMLVMVYTPMSNPTDLADSVYWEWGESYGIYEDNGVMYHEGMNQNQTASQPATFTWPEGDVYFHKRDMYSELVSVPYDVDTLNVMDANYSDFFISAVNDNGRGQAIEVNARKAYFPATNRNSLAYQENTSINQTNRFLYQNFQDYDRSFGDVYKLTVKDRYMIVGQRFKIGRVPIFNQISKDSAGNEILASTDNLLNPINYYRGDFGVGTSPESWVDFSFQSYFFDNIRGIWCRLSLDGITDLSVIYKINSWATLHGVKRVGDFKIYGAYDSVANYCIMAFAATDTEPAYTLTFDEKNRAFRSFLSYHPEMMCTLGTLLISFKDGQMWTHDNTVYNSFFGTDYESNISFVFNDIPLQKKTWMNVTEVADVIWDCPDIYTNVNTYGNTIQQTDISEQEFQVLEGNPAATIKRDINSPGGKWNGDYIKGNYCVIKFRKKEAPEIIYLTTVSAFYKQSQLTPVN